jgi:hypothetical protein
MLQETVFLAIFYLDYQELLNLQPDFTFSAQFV